MCYVSGDQDLIRHYRLILCVFSDEGCSIGDLSRRERRRFSAHQSDTIISVFQG